MTMREAKWSTGCWEYSMAGDTAGSDGHHSVNTILMSSQDCHTTPWEEQTQQGKWVNSYMCCSLQYSLKCSILCSLLCFSYSFSVLSSVSLVFCLVFSLVIGNSSKPSSFLGAEAALMAVSYKRDEETTYFPRKSHLIFSVTNTQGDKNTGSGCRDKHVWSFGGESAVAIKCCFAIWFKRSFVSRKEKRMFSSDLSPLFAIFLSQGFQRAFV